MHLANKAITVLSYVETPDFKLTKFYLSDLSNSLLDANDHSNAHAIWTSFSYNINV